jgi:predicted nucleic acid-binding protein
VRGFLLDTNVISELRRPKPDPKVVGFIAAQTEDTLFISEVTFAEIRFGIAQVVDPERRAVLSASQISSSPPRRPSRRSS